MKNAVSQNVMIVMIALVGWSCGEKTETGSRAVISTGGEDEKVPVASVEPAAGTAVQEQTSGDDSAPSAAEQKDEEKSAKKDEIPVGKPATDIPRTLRTKTEYKGALAKSFGIKQSDLDSTYNLVIDSLAGESGVSEKTLHVGFLTGITQMASTACGHFLLRNLSVVGIPQGYDSGDLIFKANIYNNVANTGEFTTTGTNFKVADKTYNIGNIRMGTPAQDANTGYGYIMFRENLRSNGITPHANNSDSLIVVRYFAGKWQYDTDAAWKDFTPMNGDRLLALVNFTTDEIVPLQGNIQDNAELPATVEAKLSAVYDRVFLKVSDRNAAAAKITELITGIADQGLAFTLGCAAAASTLAFF